MLNNLLDVHKYMLGPPQALSAERERRQNEERLREHAVAIANKVATAPDPAAPTITVSQPAGSSGPAPTAKPTCLVPMLQCNDTGLRKVTDIMKIPVSEDSTTADALKASIGFTRQLEYLIATNVNYKDDKPDSFLLGGNFVQLHDDDQTDDETKGAGMLLLVKDNSSPNSNLYRVKDGVEDGDNEIGKTKLIRHEGMGKEYSITPYGLTIENRFTALYSWQTKKMLESCEFADPALPYATPPTKLLAKVEKQGYDTADKLRKTIEDLGNKPLAEAFLKAVYYRLGKFRNNEKVRKILTAQYADVAGNIKTDTEKLLGMGYNPSEIAVILDMPGIASFSAEMRQHINEQLKAALVEFLGHGPTAGSPVAPPNGFVEVFTAPARTLDRFAPLRIKEALGVLATTSFSPDAIKKAIKFAVAVGYSPNQLKKVFTDESAINENVPDFLKTTVPKLEGTDFHRLYQIAALIYQSQNDTAGALVRNLSACNKFFAGHQEGGGFRSRLGSSQPGDVELGDLSLQPPATGRATTQAPDPAPTPAPVTTPAPAPPPAPAPAPALATPPPAQSQDAATESDSLTKAVKELTALFNPKSTGRNNELLSKFSELSEVENVVYIPGFIETSDNNNNNNKVTYFAQDLLRQHTEGHTTGGFKVGKRSREEIYPLPSINLLYGNAKPNSWLKAAGMEGSIGKFNKWVKEQAAIRASLGLVFRKPGDRPTVDSEDPEAAQKVQNESKEALKVLEAASSFMQNIKELNSKDLLNLVYATGSGINLDNLAGSGNDLELLTEWVDQKIEKIKRKNEEQFGEIKKEVIQRAITTGGEFSLSVPARRQLAACKLCLGDGTEEDKMGLRVTRTSDQGQASRSKAMDVEFDPKKTGIGGKFLGVQATFKRMRTGGETNYQGRDVIVFFPAVTEGLVDQVKELCYFLVGRFDKVESVDTQVANVVGNILGRIRTHDTLFKDKQPTQVEKIGSRAKKGVKTSATRRQVKHTLKKAEEAADWGAVVIGSSQNAADLLSVKACGGMKWEDLVSPAPRAPAEPDATTDATSSTSDKPLVASGSEKRCVFSSSPAFTISRYQAELAHARRMNLKVYQQFRRAKGWGVSTSRKEHRSEHALIDLQRGEGSLNQGETVFFRLPVLEESENLNTVRLVKADVDSNPALDSDSTPKLLGVDPDKLLATAPLPASRANRTMNNMEIPGLENSAILELEYLFESSNNVSEGADADAVKAFEVAADVLTSTVPYTVGGGAGTSSEDSITEKLATRIAQNIQKDCETAAKYLGLYFEVQAPSQQEPDIETILQTLLKRNALRSVIEFWLKINKSKLSYNEIFADLMDNKKEASGTAQTGVAGDKLRALRAIAQILYETNRADAERRASARAEAQAKAEAGVEEKLLNDANAEVTELMEQLHKVLYGVASATERAEIKITIKNYSDGEITITARDLIPFKHVVRNRHYENAISLLCDEVSNPFITVLRRQSDSTTAADGDAIDLSTLMKQLPSIQKRSVVESFARLIALTGSDYLIILRERLKARIKARIKAEGTPIETQTEAAVAAREALSKFATAIATDRSIFDAIFPKGPENLKRTYPNTQLRALVRRLAGVVGRPGPAPQQETKTETKGAEAEGAEEIPGGQPPVGAAMAPVQAGAQGETPVGAKGCVTIMPTIY